MSFAVIATSCAGVAPASTRMPWRGAEADAVPGDRVAEAARDDHAGPVSRAPPYRSW
jgi:hypothetical protein